MNDTPLKARIERQKICSGCSKDLGPIAEFDEKLRAYCEKCQNLGKVKESWMPFSGSTSISGIFVIKEK